MLMAHFQVDVSLQSMHNIQDISTFIQTFTSQFAFSMVFDGLTLILSIKLCFLISSYATSGLEDISKRDFIKTSNTYVTVELVCVAYFNSLSIHNINK